MREKVAIPISMFDYSSDFVRPVISIWMDRAQLVQDMFDALAKWGLNNVDNVEGITTGKPSDQGIQIRIPEKHLSFFFGPVGCKVTRDAVDWSMAEETAEILQAFLATLKNWKGVQVLNQKTALILHLQPTTKKFIDLLKPFLPGTLQAFRAGEITSGASVVKWKDGRITLDGSALAANSIFLKYEQEFDATASFETIAVTLRAAEEKLFQVLDIEENV
jgi:hypothetical protein